MNGEDVFYFEYGIAEIECLKRKDIVLSRAIEQIGHIDREVTPDLFRSLIHSIVGQQISTKAHQTIWVRMREGLEMTPENILQTPIDIIQAFGISTRKALYIKNAAEMIVTGELEMESLQSQSDEEVCNRLVSLPGVGKWTAEMLMIFSMQRRNVISYGDYAIQRGLRMLYRHRKITPELFGRYQRRYAPYASIASLYLWAIAGGAIEGLTDPATGKRLAALSKK